jgi:hypothetical protein
MSNKTTLSDLENELGELIAASAHRSRMSEGQIRIELEDYHGIRTTPEKVPPEVWDPDGKIRRLEDQIVALRKSIDAQKP